MTKIVCTNQETFKEPIIDVPDGLSESEITALVGHDDWDYALDDGVPTAQVNKPRKVLAAVVSAIALLPMFILPVMAEWKSPWPTKWVEINNTGYLVPYFPGKRLVDGLNRRRSLPSEIASDRLHLPPERRVKHHDYIQ